MFNSNNSIGTAEPGDEGGGRGEGRRRRGEGRRRREEGRRRRGLDKSMLWPRYVSRI